jgi:hypothetical protein
MILFIEIAQAAMPRMQENRSRIRKTSILEYVEARRVGLSSYLTQ